jgi:halimadienyl-diphosphate synthase
MYDAVGQADLLIGELGTRPVASMAYSTAQVAGLSTETGCPLFPRARRWLLEHRHADGSWGGAVPNAYDRLVSTMAAVLALRAEPGDHAASAVRSGLDYLRDNESAWRNEVGEPIGFEVVAPYLAGQLRTAYSISLGSLAELERLRADKLARMPAGVLTRQPTALLYSLEALDEVVPVSELAGFAAPNGSMANNPAATAALWTATAGRSTLAYLDEAAGGTGDGGLPEIHPINVFEPAWVLYLLGRADLLPVSAKPHIERLVGLTGGRSEPLGASAEFPAPDSDDTAMVANIAQANGYPAMPLLEALLGFEHDDHFVGFAHERGTPVSANARVLEAFTPHPHRFPAQIGKARDFLLDTRIDGAWWSDKWHLSPYYATAQAAAGLAGVVGEDVLTGTWSWLLESQHDDGSWGAAGGLPEETAHAVLAIDALVPLFGPAPAGTYRRAHTYLRERIDLTDHAELWIGKGLYTPPTVVRAAVLAACVLSGRSAA